MSWLDDFLLAVRRVRSAGTDLTQRYALNFDSSFVLTDDPANDQITVSGGGATTCQTWLVGGYDASVTPVSVVCAIAQVGDEVVSAGADMGLGALSEVTTFYEPVITTAGHVRQTSGDLIGTGAVYINLKRTS